MQRQFDNKDKYLIRHHGRDVDVETQPTIEKAYKGMDILNAHEEKNGRPRDYYIVVNPLFSP